MKWSALLSTAVVAAEARHVLHEKRSSPGQGPAWSVVERVQPDAIIPLRIGLKQNNLDIGVQRLKAVSNPTSEQYGKHLSMDEVHDMFAPDAHVVESIRDWLLDAGINETDIAHSDNKGWIAANVPASTAEELFLSELYEYENPRSGHIRIGCDEYHVPEHLVDHIDYVTPGVKMSAPLKKSLKRSGSAPSVRHHGPQRLDFDITPDFPSWWPGSLPEDVKYCGGNITPPCWRYLYNLPFPHINDSVNTVGLFEQGDYFADADLSAYWQKYAPYVPTDYAPTVLSVDGGEAPVAVTNPLDGGEADIDIDIVTALTYPQSLVVYQVDDLHYAPAEGAGTDLFNTFLDAIDGSYCTYTAYGITGDSSIDPQYPDPAPDGYKGQLQCGVYKPTRVISASYGESEFDVPKPYAERQCNEFMKLGLQGHTMLFSSGDYGVGSSQGDFTESGCLGPNGDVFNPTYPSNCPWVTSVGATMLSANQTVNDPEYVMDVPDVAPNFSSSGGFSNYYARPDYQEAAITIWETLYKPNYPTYVANANATNAGENGGRYNRAGRGFPDVAANGAYMPVFVGGSLGQFFGTSLAAPILASTITLINQQRTLIGKGPVGFLNYAIYSNPFMFNDITHGQNANCNSDGFAAVPGWDPATGMGTPNYPKMLAYFLALP